jgi:hypothetical protein
MAVNEDSILAGVVTLEIHTATVNISSVTFRVTSRIEGVALNGHATGFSVKLIKSRRRMPCGVVAPAS